MELALSQIRTVRFEAPASPDTALAYAYSSSGRAASDLYRPLSVVGSPKTVRAEIEHRAGAAGAFEWTGPAATDGMPSRPEPTGSERHLR